MKFLKLSLLPVAMLMSQAVYGQFSSVPIMPSANVPDGEMGAHAWVGVTPSILHVPGQSAANCNANGCYLFPSDLRTAYGTGSIANANGGAGITVGIVDAYYNSQTESDLAAFSTQFGLPACTSASGCLTIVNQTGGTSPMPVLDSGWALETNLDVQWVHAMAPNAKILLVTATSSTNANLKTALAYAMAHASVVTDSWGGGESAGGLNIFETTLSSSTVPILFSAGDAGAVLEYPCSSSYVTCLGGTTLLETPTSFRALESVWGDVAGDGGTGGGCSTLIGTPAYQVGFASICGTKRGVPDIAAIADPNTGVLVYLGVNVCSGQGPARDEVTCSPGSFYEIGGTSVASPVTAGYIANVDAARLAAGKTVLGSNLNTLLYGAAGGAYHFRFWDVTVGISANYQSGSPATTGFPATAGWDRATGLGVPLGPVLSAYLVSTP